ncbi:MULTISPECIES: IclR family transcriptional regulator [unclassified Mycolicibacterium]|uniref:IclR family transcriptional regulator n=1 Tax=unclassified Mycolicibacterium TaxID=2636767 RepID=UPI002EDB7650
MQKKAHRAIEKPTYLLESVDNALQLLQALRDVGALRLKDAAAQLDIAPSTAHRLLAMLVYRGFAVQDEKRTYHPGPAMGAGPAQHGWTREFTDVCRPHMETLALACGETVNLVIRVGTQVRFLTSVESNAMLRVGDRQGQVLPADRTAGGRALLAELDDNALARLYADLSAGELAEFRHELAGIRRAGFALNVELTEEGVAAFGAAVHNRSGRAVGAVTIAVPIIRYRRHSHGDLPSQLRRAVREMEVDLRDRLAGYDG